MKLALRFNYLQIQQHYSADAEQNGEEFLLIHRLSEHKAGYEAYQNGAGSVVYGIENCAGKDVVEVQQQGITAETAQGRNCQQHEKQRVQL